MKLSSGELLAAEPLLLSSGGGQYMSPPPATSKAGDMYSPILKGSAFGKAEHAVSRIHCIPLLMLFVFFVLWVASSEVLPDVRMATTFEVGASELELKMVSKNEKDAHIGGRAVLQQPGLSYHEEVASLGNTVAAKAHLRGNARFDSGRQ